MYTSVKYLLAGVFALALATCPISISAQPPLSDQTIPNPNLNSASAIVAWNAFTTDHYYKAYAPQGAHQLAALTAAVHDALNTIDQRFNFYVGDVGDVVNISPRRASRIENASPDTAIAGVYLTLLPILAADLQLWRINTNEFVFTPAEVTAFQAQVQAFSDARVVLLKAANKHLTAEQIGDGYTIGAAAANSVWSYRATDGHNRYQYYSLNPPLNYVGEWRIIGSNAMAYAQFGDIQPYAVDSISNYLAPPTPALNSTQWINDMLEVISVGTDGSGTGGVISTTTPLQRQIAYWFAGIGADKLTNYVLQSLITRDYPQLASNYWASARLFALVQIATIDSVIVNQQNKRIFNFWRPQQAILSRSDVPDPLGYPTDANGNHILSFNDFKLGAFCFQPLCWVPNVQISPTTATAMFSGIEPNTPEYPAGLPSQLASASEIASIVLGLNPLDKFPGGVLSIQYSSTVPALNFSSMNELKSLSVDGSVWAGQHIRLSGNAGLVQGVQVAHEVYSNVLQRPGYGRGRRFYIDAEDKLDRDW